MKKNTVLILSFFFAHTLYSLSDQETRALFQAAREGKTDVIKKHRTNKENCAVKDAQGNNLLHVAAEYGHDAIIDELTEYRSWWEYYISGATLPNINEKNNDGHTPLDVSITKEQYNSLVAILEAKKQQQKTDAEQLKALITATNQNDPSSLYVLEQYGYNLSLQNDNGTVLHHAVQHKKKKVIGYLAQKKALINKQNKNNKAAIMFAVEQEDEDTIDFLAYAGADINISGKDGIKPIHAAKKPHIADALLRNKALINTQDDNGYTALHHNIRNGNQEMVHYWINNKVDIKKRNNLGEAAFAFATRVGKPEIIKIIAEHPDSDVNERDNDGRTPFIRAAEEKNVNKMKELIGYNVNIALHDTMQENALHKLARNGYEEGVELIIKQNPSLLTATNKHGNIPVMVAIQNGQQKLTKVLIHYGSPLDTKNNKGETIIHEAAKLKSSTLLRELLQYTPSQHALMVDNNGFNFMHHAAAHDSVDNIKIAQLYNISCAQRTHAGDTTAHIAAKNNSINALRYLKENGQNIKLYNNNNETPFIAGALNGSLEATQYLLTEEQFITQEVAFLRDKLSRSRDYYQQKIYKFIQQQHEERLAECEKINNEYRETINLRDDQNKKSITFLTEKKRTHVVRHYRPSAPQYVSVEQLYAKTKEQRTVVLNEYLKCKTHELNHKVSFEKQINEIRLQEEKERVAQLEAQRKAEEARRKQELEQKLIEEQRVRVEQHKKEQEAAAQKALEEKKKAELEAQKAIVAENKPEEEKKEENADGEQEAPSCFVCNETEGLMLIPCKNKHTDLICKACFNQWKATKNTCPMCREKL